MEGDGEIGLPSILDICTARIETRDFIGKSLVGAVEREFNKCTANVIAFNRSDAWAHVGTDADSASHRRARIAWTEWLMFAKTVLLVLPGGKAKAKRNENLLANRIARWSSGERASLWSEALRISKADQPMSRRRPRERTEEELAALKQEEVIDLARRGLPGKAVKHASSLGLAPDTPATEARMRSKFVAPPPGQHSSHRVPAPPSNEITEEGVVKAIRSFDTGVSAGLTGQRPDLYKQLIGERGDRPSVPLFAGLSNLLASGQAPRELCPCLGGAKGTALRKIAKDGTDDARPACSGETIRRVVGKALLATENDALSEHLLPHQLAVGVKAGVEAMPHVVRQWRRDNADIPGKLWINFDEGNAHNEVDRHAFLTRMREVAPGLCKWLEYVYPTDIPTWVMYRGRIIESSAGGQQGCPLIGACHALVQRMLHESLGLVPPLEGSAVNLPRIDRPVGLDIAPLFADDGVLAGDSDELLRALRHMKTVMPSVGLRFSHLQIAAASGEQQQEDVFEEFVREGCTAVLDGNMEVLKSPIGTHEFCRAYCLEAAEKQRDTLNYLAELGDAQVSHYLLKWCVNGSRMNYLVRTTPPSATADAAKQFDTGMVDALAASCGLVLSEAQRIRVTFGTKTGGLGLRCVADRADAAYVSSRAATHGACQAIWPQHVWDAERQDDPLGQAVSTLRTKLVDGSILEEPLETVTQRKLNAEIDDWKKRQWRATATAADRVHLLAYSAKSSGRVLGVTPSKTLDMQLSQGEFATIVACHLGVDVMEGDMPCCFCGQLLDAQGLHACSCMAGGDHTIQHNAVRDVYYDYCDRAGLRPRSEAPGLLAQILGRNSRRRPADVLCIPALTLARALPDGSRAVRTEPVCLDFAVINALGPGHWADTAAAPGRAAEAYDDQKRNYLNTEQVCLEAGYRFWPVVHESQGGMSKAADAAVRAISQALADKEGRDPGAVRREMVGRVAVVIARNSVRAIRRRSAAVPRGPGSLSAAIARSWRETAEVDAGGDEMLF